MLTLSVTPDNAGYVNPSGTYQYSSGTEISVYTYSNNSSYKFIHWTANGVVVSESAEFTYTMPEADVKLVAVYQYDPSNPPNPEAEGEKYTLTLISDPANACSFSQASGSKYAEGSQMWLYAYNNDGFVFDKWIVDGEENANRNLYLTMPAHDVVVKAVFHYDPTSPVDPEARYKVTLSSQPANAASFNWNTETLVEVDQDCCVYPIPHTGYKFREWQQDGHQVSTELNYSFKMPAEHLNLVAVFDYVPEDPDNPEPEGYTPETPITITADNLTMEYGDTIPKLTFKVEGGELRGIPELSCEATRTSSVGIYDIIVSKGTVENEFVTYVAGKLTINQAPLTISAGTYTKKQYDPMPEIVLSYEGFKNNETATVLTKQAIISCAANEDSIPGEYAITLSGAEATNYDISYAAGKLIVTEPDSFTLAYIVDGELYKSFFVKYKEAINPLEEPTKEGYTFSGWSEIPETMPAHDVTVTGKFSINSYKLTYMLDYEVYKEVTYEYGATITPEPTPEGNYASFEWEGLPETMPAKDVVVHAKYTTGINEILMSTGSKRIYSPNGKQLDNLQKGANIIRMKDGSTRKVLVK